MRGSTQEDNGSVESPPPQQPAAAVVCEEMSDEGSLFKGFSVWKSGLVFAPNTVVRKSNEGRFSSRQRTARTSNEARSRRSSRIIRRNGLTSVAEELESVPSEQHPDAIRKTDNTSASCSENIKEKAGRKVCFGADFSSNSKKEVSLLSMGSREKQHEYINPFRTAADHEGENSSSFYTRTGALNSKYREYNVDVDPSQGDRAADIPLFSFSRPHMRAFHLAWMSFFVAL